MNNIRDWYAAAQAITDDPEQIKKIVELCFEAWKVGTQTSGRWVGEWAPNSGHDPNNPFPLPGSINDPAGGTD